MVSVMFFLELIPCTEYVALMLQGAVYVKCSNAEVAASASKALHGRWFAGR